MFVKHLIFFALIAFALTQHLPSNEVQNIVAGNYTVSINLRGGSFRIMKNHEEAINFQPQELVEKHLNGMPIANRSIDLSNMRFNVYEADYNKTHPVKYIRLTSQNLFPNRTHDTVFKTTITLHKNAKNIYFAEAPTGSFEISHQIENWRSCHNTGNSTTDKPECMDENMRNINETFIDLNMNIRHPYYNNETQMVFANDTIRLNAGEEEEFLFKDTYNIQPGKSIRPEWEQGYPMMNFNNQTASGSMTSLSFRFKKPVLHKYDNTMIWFNYLYTNKKEMMTSLTMNPTNEVRVVYDYNSIHLWARDDSIFFVKFNQLNVKSADGLYYLNYHHNLVNLADKYFVLKKAQEGQYSSVNAIEAFGTIGNFLENATIKVKVTAFKQDGKINSINNEQRDVHDGDVRVSFEVENFPFKNKGDTLELGYTIVHPAELKTLNESDDRIVKYAKGQADFPRWIKNDGKVNKMGGNEFPKIMANHDGVTAYLVSLGSEAKRTEWEMFLHPARKTELAPIRRFDQTNWYSNWGGNIKALGQLNVECRENEVLSYWNMKSNGSKISIEYYCISFLSVGKKAEWKYTRWNGISSKQDKSVNHLDRHKLLCDSDESVGAWRMQVSGNYIRFRYRCNKTVNTNLASRTTKWERIGEGQVQNLKEHYLFATSKYDTLKVLRGWKMSTKYVKKWCTFLCDDWQEIKFEIFYNTLRNYNDHM